MRRRIFYTLQFATGFFNAATVIPLLFVVPVMLFAWCSGKGRPNTRIGAKAALAYRAGLLSGLAMLALVVVYARHTAGR